MKQREHPNPRFKRAHRHYQAGKEQGFLGNSTLGWGSHPQGAENGAQRVWGQCQIEQGFGTRPQPRSARR